MGRIQPPKLKHTVTKEEMANFLEYLIENNHPTVYLIIELMYKFALRIGAICKLRVNSITKEGLIHFREKFGNLIKRQMISSTREKIEKYVAENNLKDNDYIFYPLKHKDDIDKRSSYFSEYIGRICKISNCFYPTSEEIITSHMFRLTDQLIFLKKKMLKKPKINFTTKANLSQIIVTLYQKDVVYLKILKKSSKMTKKMLISFWIRKEKEIIIICKMILIIKEIILIIQMNLIQIKN